MNIVFLDSQIPDYQNLAQAAVGATQVVILDSARDGIAQITDYLRKNAPVDSIHIVSHGSPATLYLGNTTLGLSNVNNYKEQLREWSVKAIYLYGCNVAAGDGGEEFITKLHQITGASIAASKTLTGNANLGGDWNLDVTRGDITSQDAFSEAARQAYAGVLATYIVNTLQDQNDGDVNGISLRDAINAANSTPGDDVIQFDPILNGNIIGLTLGVLEISDNLTIQGDSNNLTTISGMGKNQVFRITNSSANVTFNWLKIVNGYGGVGAGIDNNGNLTIINSTVTNNQAFSYGGGIYNTGNLNLIKSSVYGNSADLHGGGIDNSTATTTVLNSTIAGNTAVSGGGIYTWASKTSIFDSTVTNNSGGGIVAGNNSSTVTELANTIVAGNIGNDVDVLDNGGNTFASLNGNLIGTGNAVGSFIQPQDKTGITDPKLGPLADNGGGNLTHALLAGSPAINNGVNTTLPADTFDLDGDADVAEPLPIDQLGGDRVQYGTVDIGAVESNSIYGDDNDNLLKGTSSSDKINAYGGNDTIKGRGGNDSLDGGIGQDKLYGDQGKDTLLGGAGKDVLVGGKGKDYFLYATGQAFTTADVGIDKISDFNLNADKIVLSKKTFAALLSSPGKRFGVKSDFALISSDELAATSKALIIYNGSNGKLFYNENGEGDGFGSGGQFAALTKQPNLNARGFIITE